MGGGNSDQARDAGGKWASSGGVHSAGRTADRVEKVTKMATGMGMHPEALHGHLAKEVAGERALLESGRIKAPKAEHQAALEAKAAEHGEKMRQHAEELDALHKEVASLANRHLRSSASDMSEAYDKAQDAVHDAHRSLADTGAGRAAKTHGTYSTSERGELYGDAPRARKATSLGDLHGALTKLHAAQVSAAGAAAAAHGDVKAGHKAAVKELEKSSDWYRTVGADGRMDAKQTYHLRVAHDDHGARAKATEMHQREEFHRDAASNAAESAGEARRELHAAARVTARAIRRVERKAARRAARPAAEENGAG